MRWLRRPILHFLVAGAVLFGLHRRLDPAPAPPVRQGIVITAAQVEELRAAFREETGRTPTPSDATALVDRAVEEELLYREALARGLDRDDRSVQHRIVEKMHALSSAPNPEPAALYLEALALGLDRDDAIVRRMLIEKMRLLSSAPDVAVADAELRAFLDAHSERYRQPPRVTLQHVFFATQQRGDTVDRDAGAVLAALRRDGVGPEHAAARGDPFPLGGRFVASSERDLTRSFGPAFARAVLGLPAGTWSGPVPSPYGRHLVWVEAAEPGTVPPLAAVRGRVLEDARAEQREVRLRATIERLRAQYDVRIEAESEPGRGRS